VYSVKEGKLLSFVAPLLEVIREPTRPEGRAREWLRSTQARELSLAESLQGGLLIN
jgi:hypothetical protein